MDVKVFLFSAGFSSIRVSLTDLHIFSLDLLIRSILML